MNINFELNQYFTYQYCNLNNTAHDQITLTKVEDHLREAIQLEQFDIDQIFFIALEGSQNYQLDTENSDVDTKLILLPCLNDIVWNHRPIGTTHITENGEHISFTDIRSYFNSLRKQNINFIETLFSPWIIVNKEYEDEFNLLYNNKELIAHYNPVKAVKTIGGIAKDRYKAIQNLNSQRADLIKKYGYDGKAISHLERIVDFLYKYQDGISYEKCIIPTYKTLILTLKQNKASMESALNIAKVDYDIIQRIVDNYVNNHEEIINENAENILGHLQYILVEKGLKTT